MNSSATASYSCVRRLQGEAARDGSDRIAVADKRAAELVSSGLVITAAQLSRRFAPLPKIWNARWLQWSSASSHEMKRRILLEHRPVRRCSSSCGAGFVAAGATNDEDDTGYSQIAIFAKALRAHPAGLRRWKQDQLSRSDHGGDERNALLRSIRTASSWIRTISRTCRTTPAAGSTASGIEVAMQERVADGRDADGRHACGQGRHSFGRSDFENQRRFDRAEWNCRT